MPNRPTAGKERPQRQMSAMSGEHPVTKSSSKKKTRIRNLRSIHRQLVNYSFMAAFVQRDGGRAYLKTEMVSKIEADRRRSWLPLSKNKEQGVWGLREKKVMEWEAMGKCRERSVERVGVLVQSRTGEPKQCGTCMTQIEFGIGFPILPRYSIPII